MDIVERGNRRLPVLEKLGLCFEFVWDLTVLLFLPTLEYISFASGKL